MNKLFLVTIFLLGLFLRTRYFDSVTFAYDQARDAIIAQEIFTSDPIKLHGPRTDFENVYHGPLYWYLIAPVYYFSGGNVLALRAFLILLNLAGVPLIYILAKKLTTKSHIALFSAFIWASSFEIIQYSRWLSNPSPALITTLLTLIFFIDFLTTKKAKYLAISLLFWGFSVQFELFLLYQAILLLIIYIAYRGLNTPKLAFKDILILFISLITGFLPFILAELKFNFISTRSLLGNTLNGSSTMFLDQFNSWINRFILQIQYSIFSYNNVIAGCIALFIVVYLIASIFKSKDLSWRYISIFSFGSFILYFFKGTDGIVVNMGSQVTIYICIAIILSKLNPKVLFFALLIIFLGNYKLINTNMYGEKLFMPQNMSLLLDELKIIDTTYKKANGQDFAINAITSPLFTNNIWAYLYKYYGQKKYGYMPSWIGEPQVGVFSQNILFSDKKSSLLFLIIEPGPGIPKEYICGIQRFENLRSKLVQRQNIGQHELQERTITDQKYKYTGNSVGDYTKTSDFTCTFL